MGKHFSSKEIISVLEGQGFHFKSQKGSHVKYVKEAHTVIIPHPRKDIPQGTFNSIVRQSGLNKTVFYT